MRGALLIVSRAGGPVWFGKWRDASGRQVKRLLGPAWVVPDGDGWRPRRGRPAGEALHERSALLAMAAAIERHELERVEEPPAREPTFADAVERWLHHQEFVAGVKPSPLPTTATCSRRRARRRGAGGRTPSCRIMRAFSARPLRSITTTERYLHARPRRDDAARMTKVFEASVTETATREIER